MNIYYLIISILVFICIVLYIRLNSAGKTLEKMAAFNPGVSLETKKADMDLLYSYLNRSFLKALNEFSSKDFSLSVISGNKRNNYQLYSNKYKDLISCLIRPDLYLTREEDDGNTNNTLFFEYFVQKIYLMYVSETPESIKNLLFKYHSGYSIDSYFQKKKPKPTCIPFITEYVRNKLWARYAEAESETQKLLDDVRNSSPDGGISVNYVSLMDDYDQSKLRAIKLNIYHMTDTSEEYNNYHIIPSHETNTNKSSGGK